MHLSIMLIKVNSRSGHPCKSYFCKEIKCMNKINWLKSLMAITLLVITGFQLYWLKDSYDREKRSLDIKANVHFQETVRHLQAVKLKMIDPSFTDSAHGKMKVFISDDMPPDPEDHVNGLPPRQEIITMVNSMRNKLNDSLKKEHKENETMLISVNKTSYNRYHDSMRSTVDQKIEISGGKAFQYLYQVDSLQDSIKVMEISTAYAKALRQEKLNVPFNILRLVNTPHHEMPDMSEVTVGFVHPVTYKLQLGNSLPYLVKKISLPILFSLFLVGVTLLSFILLYRAVMQQRRLGVIRNDFISNVTHELKTPIATVGVAIEALRNFNALQDPARTKEYLDISSNELQRLSLLVDKVLRLSMFENEQISLQKESFDLAGVIQQVIATMKLQLEKQHAIVAFEVKGDQTIINADKLHIISVVYNLLDNALKYSKEDPDIKIDIISRKQYVELRVQDKGIGIAPEYKSKIFDKFFRVPGGNRHNVKGYGLGLSYVDYIIKRHKGYIEVDSKPGEGSVFIVKFPYEENGIIDYSDNPEIKIKKEIWP